MNLLEIKQECGRLLNDPQNDRWSGDVITARANKIQSEVQALTKAVKTSGSYTPSAGSAFILLNENIIDIAFLRMQRQNGTFFYPKGISKEELYYRYPEHENWEASEPRFYYFVYQETGPFIRFSPPPDAANSITNGVIVYEIRKPTDMDSDDDEPFDGNGGMIPFHMVVVHGVVSLCWMDDGTPEALAKATYHRSNDEDRPGQYEKQIKLIKNVFDSPTDVSMRVQWKPQGGRLGRWGRPSKASPLG